MHNGCILCGGVGSGKSRTSLAYYFTKIGGGEIHGARLEDMTHPVDLYIVTTARKRDTREWQSEMVPFLLGEDAGYYSVKVTVDSWNNIQKYADVKDAFFIFDEQRVVGSGAWVKAFLKIARHNRWVLLSATPGDTWMDYVPVFVANGYYKNRTDFTRQHVVYSRFSKYPKVDRYVNCRKLLRQKNEVLIPMDYHRPTAVQHEHMTVNYDRALYRRVMTERWNVFDNKPLADAGALCYALRRVVNSDPARLAALDRIREKSRKIIVFYNFDYEIEMLRDYAENRKIQIGEWNGHRHEPIPNADDWLYAVQYTAGAEGWNCIETDTIVFYSQNYSYKTMVQAAGRIDRLNSPFDCLHYYHLVSASPIDLAIRKALQNKKNFNESKFAL